MLNSETFQPEVTTDSTLSKRDSQDGSSLLYGIIRIDVREFELYWFCQASNPVLISVDPMLYIYIYIGRRLSNATDDDYSALEMFEGPRFSPWWSNGYTLVWISVREQNTSNAYWFSVVRNVKKLANKNFILLRSNGQLKNFVLMLNFFVIFF